MGKEDHHEKPYDEGTLAKLEIYELYCKEWLGTMIHGGFRELVIVDFFSGPGQDIRGTPGSPRRILQNVLLYKDDILKNNVTITIYFNDKNSSKISELNRILLEYKDQLQSLAHSGNVKIVTTTDDFDRSFQDRISEIQVKPSLVFLDQLGVKFANEKYLIPLVSADQIDFLYFLSSNHARRFSQGKGFKEIFSLTPEEAESSQKFIHEVIVDKMRSKLPDTSGTMLYPYSMKNRNGSIYGIMFGSSSLRGVDKFLKVAWKQDQLSGASNFDLYNDKPDMQTKLNLFNEETTKVTKLMRFQRTAEELILNGTISTNSELLQFAYSKGHIAVHAREVVTDLKNRGLVSYSGRPCVSYEYTFGKKVSWSYIH